MSTTLNPQTFEAALPALKTGKRIRRQSWPASYCLIFNAAYTWPGEEKPCGNIMRQDQYGGAGAIGFMALNNRDILATDWEILD